MKNKNGFSRVRKSFKEVATDTAVYFGAGDTVVAAATAEPMGVAINAVSAAAAVVGRVTASLTGKNIGLGFRSAAAVSAYTVCSIIYKGIKDHGMSSCLLSFNAAAGGVILPAAAFAFWTIANMKAGHDEVHGTHARGVWRNPQTWFCLGSAAVAGNNLFSTSIFLGAIAKAAKEEVADEAETKTWAEFANKHSTTKRLRAISYGVSAVFATMTAIVNPISALYLFPAAYGLFMAGNIFFDKGKNKVFCGDVAHVMCNTPISRPAGYYEHPSLDRILILAASVPPRTPAYSPAFAIG